MFACCPTLAVAIAVIFLLFMCSDQNYRTKSQKERNSTHHVPKTSMNTWERPEGHDESCKLKKVTTHFHCFIFSNHPPTRVSLFSIFSGGSLRRFAFNLEIISWHQFFCPRPFRRHAGLVQPNSAQPCNSGRKLIAQRLIGRTCFPSNEGYGFLSQQVFNRGS